MGIKNAFIITNKIRKQLLNFKSDNTTPVHSEILKAIQEANIGHQNSYGQDEYSQRLQERLSILFETDVVVYLTNTGTAANALALSTLIKPYQEIYCHSEAHIHTNECGAGEFYTAGAKLVTFPERDGKIKPDAVVEKVLSCFALRPHQQSPGCISITQATECGTVYSLEELKAIKDIAAKYNIPIHMDGARFANALAFLKCSPADMTWRVGVDALSFGATKNGALCAEALIFFDPQYAQDFDYLHKRAGQLMSKSRFFACQFLAYLENDLWVRNAEKANAMAQKLAQVFRKYGVENLYEVQANELFVRLTPPCAENLKEKGVGLYPWGVERLNTYRFVTSFYTSDEDIQNFDLCLSKMNRR